MGKGERDFKFLQTSFGLNLKMQDVDPFLINKILKKLKFWSTIHFLIDGRGIIMKYVLSFDTLWFFMTI